LIKNSKQKSQKNFIQNLNTYKPTHKINLTFTLEPVHVQVFLYELFVEEDAFHVHILFDDQFLPKNLMEK